MNVWKTIRTASRVTPHLACFLALWGLSGTAAQSQFAVTGAALSADPTSYNGPCPGVIKFNGKIAANGQGTVKYQFIRSDGGVGAVQTLVFTGPGSKPVSTTWTLGGPSLPEFAGWEAIKILSPNPMESNHADFKLVCANTTKPQRTKQADITSKRGIKVGNKFAAWGGTLKLDKTDVYLESNGNYAFNISYDVVNAGSVNAGPFANRFRSDMGTLITQQTAVSVNASSAEQINTQGYLPQGDHMYKMSLDDGNVVAESNEGNNTFSVRIIFNP
ncbi:MAG: hypothetical protein IPM61_06995 [Chlorobi bacterium]|nr:MAG: hypothetical protein UZ07_CHB004003175 [Chlorobi bacterium OLB7]MBK8911061.1 hypothetical protein [Chlorobiota bacterium]MBX7216857.1 hypothetical protein [Candidatus Kapabacteria bacterium]